MRPRTCERFFIDLGINSVEVIVLGPLYDASDAYDAARSGDYLTAVLLTGATACEVAKSCGAVAGPFMALSKLCIPQASVTVQALRSF